MKVQKTLVSWIIFFLTIAVSCILFYMLDTRYGTYSSGTTLSRQQAEHCVPITNAVYDPVQQGYHFTIVSPESDITDALSLAMINSREFSIYQDQVLLFTQAATSTYAKAVIINLKPFSVQTEIFVKGSARQSNAPFSFPKLNTLLAKTLVLEELTASISSWGHVFLGILLAMFLSCISLYYFKPSEKYLLYIAIGIALNFINLAIPLQLLGIHITYQIGLIIRPVLLIACAVYLSYMIILIYQQVVTDRFLHLLCPKYILLLIFVASLLQSVFFLSIYNILRMLICIPVVLTLDRARQKNLNGAGIFLIMYGFSEAVALYVFTLNHLAIPLGSISSLWRTSEITQSLLLLVALLSVDKKFADKFSASEHLSEELAEFNHTLEQRVKERTHQLTEQQQQRHILMQNIFHDVRSPIYILKDQLHLLPDTPENRDVLYKMKQRLDYLERLVSDLFLVSKLESNKVIFDEDEVFLDQLTKELCISYTSAHSSGIHLSCQTEPCCIWGDQLRLQQLIQNLLDNAVHHTPSGGSIYVKLEKQEDYAILSVRDSGKGIPAEELPLVFQRYYSSKASHNSDSSGLGLSIAKEIARAHGGSITVSSTVGKGSTFTIRLPLLSAKSYGEKV